jgi:anti-sigma-K factor RskA
MSFKTQAELVAFSTGVFYDNTVGGITPSGFRQMHENITDSMIPYDASGVFQVNTTPTGGVPTPTPTGAMVFNSAALYVFDGTNWQTFSADT